MIPNFLSNNDAHKNFTRVLPLAEIYVERMNEESLKAWREQDRGFARLRNPARMVTFDTDGGGQGDYL